MTTRVIDNLLVRLGYEVDEASRRQAANSLQNMQRTLKSFALGMAAAGTAVTDVTVKAVTTFAGQQATFAKIEGLVGVARSEIEKMIPAVDKLAVATGVGPQKLADALFYVTSAGYRGAEALDILAASVRAEVAGLGQAAQIADFATSAINAYGSENLSAAEAMDQLTMAVRLGKLETESIAPVIGSVLPLASRLQVPLKDTLGILAAMSRTGTDAAEGATQLSAVMSQLIKPSQAGEDLIFERLGMTMDEVRAAVAERGLLPVLGMLEEAVDKNDDAMGTMFNNIRALKGVFDLLGENAEATTEIMEGMAEAEGTLNEAFEINVRTLKGQYGRVMAATAVLWKDLGEAMAPVVEDKLVRAIEILSELTEWFKEQPEWVKEMIGWMVILGPVLLGVGLGASVLSMALGGLKLLLGPLLLLKARIIALGGVKAILGTIGAAIASVGWPVWVLIAAIAALAFGIWYLWGPQIKQAWADIREAIIDPLIAQILTWWDEQLWPSIVKAWEEQDFEPLIAAIETLWDQILWPTIQWAWVYLREAFVDPIIAKINTWWEEQEWTDIEWWWDHLRGILNPILAHFGIEIPTWAVVKANLVGLWNNITGWWNSIDWDIGIQFVLSTWADIQAAWNSTIAGIKTGIKAALIAAGFMLSGWAVSLSFVLSFLVTSWEELQTNLSNLWTSITDWWNSIDWTFILQFVIPPWESIQTQLSNLWTNITGWWNSINWAFAIQFVLSTWEEIQAAWSSTIAGIKAGIQAALIAAGMLLVDGAVALAIGLTFPLPTWESIQTELSNLWTSITGWWNSIDWTFGITISIPEWADFETLVANIKAGWQGLADSVSSFTAGITIDLPKWEGDLDTKLDTWWNAIRTKISNWWNGIDWAFGLKFSFPVWNELQTTLDNWWNGIKPKLTTWWDGIDWTFGIDFKMPTLPTFGGGVGSGEEGDGDETWLQKLNPFDNEDDGGISMGRTLRWLSWNNRPEAVIPLHRFDEVMRPFAKEMMPALAGGGTVQIDQRVGDINVNVAGSGGDANAIAREVGAEVRKQFRDLADEMDSAIRR